MGKLRLNKAYTVLETIIVLMVLSICSLTTLCLFKGGENEEDIIERIVLKQFKAIMLDSYQEYESDEVDICFTHLGSVTKAQSFDLNDEEYVISLGTGRIYQK